MHPLGFFAYPSAPASVGDAIRGAEDTANAVPGEYRLVGWERCSVGGKVIIDAICRKIDECDFFCADLTGVNPNVMFELGYAIALDKRVWLTLDTSLEESQRAFEQVKVITTVGYAEYRNSDDIVAALGRERPWDDLGDTVYQTQIRNQVDAGVRPALLYMKHCHEMEAAKKVTKEVERVRGRGIALKVDDPAESTVQSLAWYGQMTFSAYGVIMFLCEPERKGAVAHNARYALVAGLAHGFGKPLLMLAHTSYRPPIDYRDMLQTYRDANEAQGIATNWLSDRVEAWVDDDRRRRKTVQEGERVRALRSIRLGDHIAENEGDDLGSYFVETAAYDDARAARHAVFVGRKGAGKTATLLRLAEELGSDRRNLVCTVQPEYYDLESLVALLGRCKERGQKGYLVQALWKYLLYTEIARSLVEMSTERPVAPDPHTPIGKLAAFVASQGWGQADLAGRLECSVRDLFAVEFDETVTGFRAAVSEALHSGAIRQLHGVLDGALASRRRVAILVDNLDKAWHRGTDIPLLSELVLGLFTAAQDVGREISRLRSGGEPVQTTLAIFLRSDIFAQVMRASGEPDKITHSRIVWDDPQVLLRVVEERYAVRAGRPGQGIALWSNVFCPTVRGMATKDYILETVLPRPRDIVFLCNAAIAVAVNRGHESVGEDDVLTAERQYSQLAFEMAVVESDLDLDLVPVLYEFAGAPTVLDADGVRTRIERAGVRPERQPGAFSQLRTLSFLGTEVAPGRFEYPSDEDDLRKAEVRSRNLASERGEKPRYAINRPFHAFLDIGAGASATSAQLSLPREAPPDD